MATSTKDLLYVETLKRERDRFVALAFCAADILLEVDTDFVITYAAGATVVLTDCPPDELIGTSMTQLIAPEDRALFNELVRGMSAGKRLEPVSIHLRGVGGPSPPLLLTGYHLPELPSSFFFAMRLGSAATSEVIQNYPRDAETGLLDTNAFAHAASARMRDAHKHGEDLQLTMLRLPELGALREKLDEEASKSLIQTVGACLRVGSGVQETAARFDEENYGLIHKLDLDIDELRGRLETHLSTMDPAGVGISVKTGTVPADIGEASEADQIKALLYTVTQFCEDTNEEPSIDNLAANLERLIHEATRKMSRFRRIVSDEHFDVAFQPIVRIASGDIHHFEALARFGGGSSRSPYELITFAEDTGMISDFDYAMCRKLLGWLEAANELGKRYVVAVNLSGRSVGKPSFLGALKELLSRHESVRSQLVIEITESARIRDLELANNFIQSLRQCGHIVCLDDFGAGAAALKYLHDLDVDIVKIDGQYIQGAEKEPKMRAFLKAIAGLCSELGIATVAEMVEEEKTLELLRDCRIELGQGYLFGRPSSDISVFDDGVAGSAKKKTASKRRRASESKNWSAKDSGKSQKSRLWTPEA